jgi:hypothetical protein
MLKSHPLYAHFARFAFVCDYTHSVYYRLCSSPKDRPCRSRTGICSPLCLGDRRCQRKMRRSPFKRSECFRRTPVRSLTNNRDISVPTPPPQSGNNNRGGTDQMFWFNSHKKESRATEYWSSEKDEYALPPMQGDAARKAMAVPTEERFEPQGTGFMSARSRLMDNVASRLGDNPRFSIPTPSTDKPRAHRSSSAVGTSLRAKMEYDEKVSLDFGQGGDMTAAGSSSKTDFGKANKQSLNAMKNVGLPSPITTLWKEETTGGSPIGVNNFQSASSSSLAMMKSLGMPEPSSSADPVRKAGGGNKRLGVGRTMAPWGTKKPRND